MSSTKRIVLLLSHSHEGDESSGGMAGRTGAGALGARVGQDGICRRERLRRLGVALGLGGALAFAPGRAHAQAGDVAPPPMETMPPPPPPPGGVTPAQALTPPLATEAMPATREDKLPPISVGAWVRAGARVQGGNPKNLDGERMDTVYGELHAGGKIHKNVSLTLNLNADGLHGAAAIEDAIIGFDFAPEVHLWVGQLLVPVDRANYGGPFFMIPWNYPGFLSVGNSLVVTAPAEGPNGRNAGASLWGVVGGGVFRYALGAFQAGPVTDSPLFSGRLSLALVGNESGYFGNETYFGDQTLVSVAVGGQEKKNGSVGATPKNAAGVATGPALTDDYGEFNADALAEVKYGDGGWVTGEFSYYHFEGMYNTEKNAFYALGAIATPKVGPGNIQPMIRYQWGAGDGATPKAWSLDAAISYLIMGPALRVLVNYQHTDLGNDLVGNMVQLGAQAIFF
jgi:hypothetical protein